MRVMTVFGTRPEAIKMAPLVLELEKTAAIDSVVCVSGQHREMLDQVLDLFEITPDHDLQVMRKQQTLTHVTTAVLEGLEQVFREVKPDVVLVHGDTSTSMVAALAAFYAHTPVGHVEAGLRTGDLQSPWPEEMNRVLTGRLASYHYAPTQQAEANLLAEGVRPEDVLVTGNTVIDALHWVRDNRLTAGPELQKCTDQFAFLDSSRPLILVTGHRRESFDGGLDRMCSALRRIAEERQVEIVYPVHRNPVVVDAATRVLGGIENVHLIDPLEYIPFVWMMSQSRLIITDSGGVQEEAPALGVPVLVTRETTERPEALDAGVVRLVGTDPDQIGTEALKLLDDDDYHANMARGGSPYGDGYAAGRIVEHLLRKDADD